MKLDPITFEVVNNALVGAAEQMAATILRTSYSTVIREMLDYSTAVFDLEGRIIAQSCLIPIHLNSMSRSFRTTLTEVFPIDHHLFYRGKVDDVIEYPLREQKYKVATCAVLQLG